MKNHIMRNGKLLLTNKRFDQLSTKQRDWIRQITESAHAAYTGANSRLPIRQQEKQQIVAAVEEQVQARDIWLPKGVLETEVLKNVARLNRKSSLNTRNREH